MANSPHYDCVVIGSGQGGKPLAIALAKAGRRTAIIERKAAGGSCVNWGCTPTKTMVASARSAYLAGRSSDFGVHTGKVRVNLAEVKRRKDAMVENFREGVERAIEKTAGLDLLMGEARFVDSKRLNVQMQNGDTLQLSADMIFINTGVRPALPPVEGLQEIPILNSTTVMELEELPKRLLILGGSYIGLEFGQMFRRFGSKVAVVELQKQLLPLEDSDVAEEVAQIMRQDGLEIYADTKALRAEKTGEGKIQLTVKTPERKKKLKGSHLLVSTGQTPNTDALNLEAAGVRTDKRGYVQVNDRLETNVPGIYALGDVKGGPAFTHISYDDFRVLRANVLESGKATTEGRLIPYTVYIDPQLGRVGLTEKEAREQGRSIRVAKLPMSHVARALEVDEARGFMKAIVDPESREILGCAMLGLEGGELMSMIEIAMMGKLPYTALREGIFAHPTLAEALNNLFMAMEE